jgi:hypothetical protein
MQEIATIQTFLSYFPGRVVYSYGGAETIPSDLKGVDESIALANSQGKPIYFVPNELAGNKRVDTEVVRCRSVFLDDDDHIGDNRSAEFALEPNLCIQTSPGKWQYHWLTDTTDIDEWRGVVRGMIEKYETDPACKNPARILRMPGFVNIKEKYHGWVVRCLVNREQPYTWTEITKAFPPAVATIIDSGIEKGPREAYIGDDEALRLITSGEGIHEGRTAYSMHHASLGTVTEEACIQTLMMALELGKVQGNIEDSRYRERKANMQAVIHSAYEKRSRELNIVPIRRVEAKKPYTDLPMPSGGLLVVTNDILKYMPHPHKDMAIPSAQHVVGLFSGGLFKLDSCIGNRKRTLLASSTMGKSIAGNYIRELTRRMATHPSHRMLNVHRYDATDSYTPAMLHADLYQHRVRGSVVNEAGLDGQSKAGMGVDLRRQWMEILTFNNKSVLTSKKYSQRSNGKALNDELSDCYGVCCVQIAESVPQNFVEVLHKNNAFISGDVGRQELVFVEPVKARRNFEANGDLADEVVDAMFKMVCMFEDTGYTSGDNPANVDQFLTVDLGLIMEEYRELYEAKIDLFNNTENDILKALHGRYMERLMTTLLVQVQADIAFGYQELPQVTQAHFDYAVHYQDELERSLLAQMDGGSLDGPLERCIAKVEARMDNFGTLAYDQKFAADYRQRKVGRQWITKIVSERADWKELVRLHYGKNNLAMNELLTALEDKGILIRETSTSKVPVWRLNK